MRIAISGKGGVGKTTIAAALARHLAEQGHRVVAIDADPDANLAAALGATPEQTAACEPLSSLDDLIEERTGARPGAGGMFRLNPDVSDVVETCGIEVAGVTLLRMGTVERGGAGCMCSESVFLKAFLRDVLIDRDEDVVMDMEAGVEHLGRGTAEAVDVLLVVVEPGMRSLATATQVARLAGDLGIPRVVAVCNKAGGPADEEYCASALGEIPLVATFAASDAVRGADRDGVSPYEADEDFASGVRKLAGTLTRLG